MKLDQIKTLQPGTLETAMNILFEVIGRETLLNGGLRPRRPLLVTLLADLENGRLGAEQVSTSIGPEQEKRAEDSELPRKSARKTNNCRGS